MPTGGLSMRGRPGRLFFGDCFSDLTGLAVNPKQDQRDYREISDRTGTHVDKTEPARLSRDQRALIPHPPRLNMPSPAYHGRGRGHGPLFP